MPRQASARPEVSLKTLALRLLARRDYSRVELAARLRQAWARQQALAGHTHPETQRFAEPAADAPPPLDDAIAAVLNELQALGLHSEERALASQLRQRSARLGAARVQQDLRRLGFARDAAQTAVATLADTEAARAQALWTRRYGAAPAADAAARARQFRFLVSRGFCADVARKLVWANGSPAHDD